LRGASGRAIPNGFPIRYFDSPVGRVVSNPDAAPPVHVPRVVTPALTP
jgi:hypothetical protein